MQSWFFFKMYPFSLSTDGNMLKPVLPGLRLGMPLNELFRTVYILKDHVGALVLKSIIGLNCVQQSVSYISKLKLVSNN